MLDLGQLKDVMLETNSVVICHPETGVATDIKIVLASPDSEVYRKVSKAIRTRSMQFAMKNRGAASADRIEQDALDLLVGVTVSWENMIENGVDIPCTKENVRRVYDTYLFIREQVDDFIGNRRNFFKD